MDKLEFVQWPHVTRFKKMEHIIQARRDHGLGTSSTSHKLAEIDQAKPVQDLDDVGSVFGSTRCESHNCVNIMNPGKNSGGQ